MISKKEYEKRRKEDEQATAYAFQEFITTFQDVTDIPNKTFVKSATLNPGSNRENSETRQIYNPKPLIKPCSSATIKHAIECARIIKDNKLERIRNKQDKPKSNLESFKEELKSMHAERQEQAKYREQIASQTISCLENDDPTTTNLFIARLSSKLTKNDLIQLFGLFGPLASVKIMWPRSDEPVTSSNCGFVAFMARKDAERALKQMKGRDDMRVGWAKRVEIPSYPIYIPDTLLVQYLPPPASNLPFNAQPLQSKFEFPKCEEELQILLEKSTVKVTIPMNKKTLWAINRMVEFVVREGPMFEAFIMNKEINNPEYNFLFDNQCAEHIYYRWKIFSILHGDDQNSWSMKPFRMYVGGSIWIPPAMPKFQDGMPEELISPMKQSKKQLTDNQHNRLMHLIRNLSLTRYKIAEAMVFCIDHSDEMDDILHLILDSMKNVDTNPLKKLARLFLLSDVIHNAINRKIDINLERKHSEDLIKIFKSLHSSYKSMKYPLDKENFELRITKVLRYWNVHHYMSDDLIKKLECNFMNNSDFIVTDSDSDDGKKGDVSELTPSETNKKNVKPFDDNTMYSYFVPSKWDTIDPDEVETQAMSSEKLYYIELKNKGKKCDRNNVLEISNRAPSKWDSAENEPACRDKKKNKKRYQK